MKLDHLNPDITLSSCKTCGEILKKPIKVLQCKHKFCLNFVAAFLSGKTEEELQCPACKIDILKVGISPSSDLQILLPLLKTQCKTCSKKNYHQYSL